MLTQTMVQPSSLLPSGLRLEPLGDFYLFKFTEELQMRLEHLLEKNKNDMLAEEEKAELEGIGELERIFTIINAQIAANAKWCPIKLENSFNNAPDTFVNIVTPQNI